MFAKSPIGEGWTGALAGEFLPHPDQFATVDLRTDDSRQHANPVERNDLDLPIFMIIDTASKNFLAGNVAQCGDVEPVRAGCLPAVPELFGFFVIGGRSRPSPSLATAPAP